MNNVKTGNRNSLANLISIVLLIAGIITSFVLFYHSNVKRIRHQNENYISDIAHQKAVLFKDLFEENLSYIESSAIVLETAFLNQDVDTSKLNVPDDQIDQQEVEKVANILRTYEKRFAFNYLRFIDRYGRDYTTGEKVIAANVKEREYFKQGVTGITGISYILDSKVTSERQIGFYSPVYQNGEIAGIAVGFYGESFIDNLRIFPYLIINVMSFYVIRTVQSFTVRELIRMPKISLKNYPSSLLRMKRIWRMSEMLLHNAATLCISILIITMQPSARYLISGRIQTFSSF